VFLRGFLNRATSADAGIIDEDINLAGFLPNVFHRPCCGYWIVHVKLKHLKRQSFSKGHVCQRGCPLRGIPHTGKDTVSLAGKMQRGSLADPCTRACD
jgi:hypothetical protein